MYEAFFGLQRRPFAATPDPQCWYAGGPYQSAIDELVVCAEQGQGIAMLVAPAGAGKTILCERLVHELSPRFDTVLLRHATFQTRRALLQTLLCEMEQPFDKPTDQELRLGLAPVLRRLHQLGRALVLIVDEAHLLSESLLEELRILSDQAQDGKPLVRLVLVGQPGLEEKLVLPTMQALNHRIRAQVALSTLTRQETADYLDYRLTWAGGRSEELFSTEAIDQICQATDGLPRCVNQLCDHTLLLAYATEKRPADASHVAAALDDLKHLSLPWNPISKRSLPSRQDTAITWETGTVPASLVEEPPRDGVALADADEKIPTVISEDSTTQSVPVYRLSAQLETNMSAVEEPVVFATATPPAWNAGAMPLPQPALSPELMEESGGFVEEVVVDRYTALDAGLTPPEMPIPIPAAVELNERSGPAIMAREAGVPIPAYVPDQELSWNTALARISAANDAADRFDAIDDALQTMGQCEDDLPSHELTETADLEDALAEAASGDGQSAEDVIGSTVLEIIHDTQEALAAESHVPESAVLEFGGEDVSPVASIPAAETHTAAEPRRYRHLFTMLRRKQRG